MIKVRLFLSYLLLSVKKRRGQCGEEEESQYIYIFFKLYYLQEKMDAVRAYHLVLYEPLALFLAIMKYVSKLKKSNMVKIKIRIASQ